MMEKIYYIVVNNVQEGPYSKEDLKYKYLKGDTLIWRTGLPEWVRMEDLAEVADILPIDITDHTAQQEEDNGWFAMLNGRRIGPSTITELIAAGVTLDTPVWHAGMGDWAKASTQREFNERMMGNVPPNFGPNRQYQYGQTNFSNNPYGQHPSGNSFNNMPQRMNWLPWAIGATVVGFIFSCIGAIFGIIAIVQSNKANGFYTAGFDMEGDQANNSAKTMTIIAYILAGIGLIFSGFLFRSGGVYSWL